MPCLFSGLPRHIKELLVLVVKLGVGRWVLHNVPKNLSGIASNLLFGLSRSWEEEKENVLILFLLHNYMGFYIIGRFLTCTISEKHSPEI